MSNTISGEIWTSTVTPSLPPRAWRLLGRAVLWLGLALTAGFLVEVPALWPAFVAGFKAGRAHVPVPHIVLVAWPLLTQFAIFVGYGVLLIGAVRGTRWAVSRDEGLADRPMQQCATIVWLTVLQVGWLLILMALRGLARHHGLPTPTIPMTLTMPATFGLSVLKIAEICVVAPAVEELFFRGWLWTALRRIWGPVPTALCTGGLFLLMHAPGGKARLFILLPITIILSVARHRGDSVRASLTVHMVNNGVVAAEVWLLPLLLGAA
jgi:membrane protease YdiL (CAAX protease family)